MKRDRKRLILAFLASSIITLFIGLLTSIAANTLKLDWPQSIIPWVMLVVFFLIALPINLYLFLRGTQQNGSSSQREENLARQKALLPAKPYLRFFGRDAHLAEIMNLLREPERKRIVGIDGMGGIGKTALVREIVERSLAENLFDAIIWEPRASDIATANTSQLSWSSLVVAIGRQLGAPDIQRLSEDEKVSRLTNLLGSQRALIILDNLETAATNQDELVQRLAPLLANSKAIMTSRRRFRGDIYGLHLSGLEEENAVQMIRYEAVEKGIAHVANAQSRDLMTIAQTTGGSPLALKLVVGQLQHLPLNTVLDSLKHVQIQDQDSTEEDDYIRFYKGLFWKSWEFLSDTGKRLLISMSVFAPGLGGTLDALAATSGLEEKVLPKTVEELWRLSFVEVGESSLRKKRYYLHPLTQYFVMSDIVKPQQAP